MITCFFGVPGVGKNTMLTKIARREIRRKKLGLSTYEHIYSDFYIKGAEKFDYSYFKTHKCYNSLILIEEMGLNADNRKFKTFSPEERDYFVLHRHIGNDIIYATQDYSMVDSKIRSLTQELWYMSRSVVPFIRNFTIAKRIYRCIAINENVGDLILGYRFCNLIESLFVSNAKLCYRPFYYKYFDSYDEGSLSNRPVLESEPWASGAADKKGPSLFTIWKERGAEVLKHKKQATNQSVLADLNNLESQSQETKKLKQRISDKIYKLRIRKDKIK